MGDTHSAAAAKIRIFWTPAGSSKKEPSRKYPLPHHPLFQPPSDNFISDRRHLRQAACQTARFYSVRWEIWSRQEAVRELLGEKHVGRDYANPNGHASNKDLAMISGATNTILLTNSPL